METKKRAFPFKDKYADLYGLRVAVRDERTSEVVSVVCRFCESFGREQDEETKPNRKRQKRTTTKHFKEAFRTSNIQKHLSTEHPAKWAEYQVVRKNRNSNPEEFSAFFKEPQREVATQKRGNVVGRTRVFAVDKDIVDVILKDLMGDSDGRGGAAPKPFEPAHQRKDDGTSFVAAYTFSIRNPAQFDSAVALLAAGLSFQQISNVVRESRDRRGTTPRADFFSPSDASDCARHICALSLQIIAELMAQSWAFFVATDVFSDEYGHSYLDIRIRFPPVVTGGKLLSFHLFTLALSGESYTGDLLFNLLAKVLQALCPDWERKLIGFSTPSAADVKGNNVGMPAGLADAVKSDPFYRVWCLGRRLDSVANLAISAVHDRSGLPFMTTLAAMVCWLRRQEDFIREIGSKCPSIVDDSWTSLWKALKWLLANRKAVCNHFQLQKFAGAPPKTWWLLAMISAEYFSCVNITSEALQIDVHVVSKQYDNLGRLLTELRTQCRASRDTSMDFEGRVQATGDGQGFSLGQFRVTTSALRTMTLGINVAASELEASLSEEERLAVLRCAAILYLVSLNGIGQIMCGRPSAQHQGKAIPHVLPLNLLCMSPVDFVALIRSHKSRLLSSFDDTFIQDVCTQHKVLNRMISTEPSLRSQLESAANKGFAAAWAPMGSRVEALRTFAAGIATVMPVRSHGGKEVSLMGYRRNENRSALTDLCVEGIMHAKQYSALQDAAMHL